MNRMQLHNLRSSMNKVMEPRVVLYKILLLYTKLLLGVTRISRLVMRRLITLKNKTTKETEIIFFLISNTHINIWKCNIGHIKQREIENSSM